MPPCMISERRRVTRIEVPMEPQAIAELLGKSALFGALVELARGAIASGLRRMPFHPDQMISSLAVAGR